MNVADLVCMKAKVETIVVLNVSNVAFILFLSILNFSQSCLQNNNLFVSRRLRRITSPALIRGGYYDVSLRSWRVVPSFSVLHDIDEKVIDSELAYHTLLFRIGRHKDHHVFDSSTNLF